MKTFLTTLFLVCATVASAQSVTLAWNASPSPEVVAYRIYYGLSSRDYTYMTNCGLVLTQVVELPHTGRWFFAATVTDVYGLESPFSNEVEWEAKPEPPVMDGETWVRLSPVIECSTNLATWSSVTGVPTWFRCTNEMEFFATRRLLIERVKRIEDQ